MGCVWFSLVVLNFVLMAYLDKFRGGPHLLWHVVNDDDVRDANICDKVVEGCASKRFAGHWVDMGKQAISCNLSTFGASK